MIGLNDLPSEILMKIFSYLPEYKDVALVCRRFYHAVCILDGPGMCVQAFQRQPSDDSDSDDFLQSILNSTRTIRKMIVSFMEHSPIVVDILEKFGETIKYLKMYTTNASNLIEAISLVPNVSHLCIVHEPDSFSQPSGKRLRCHNSAENGELNLRQLRKLNLEYANQYEVSLVFNRLPVNVLVELKLHHTSLPNLRELFQKQSTMKKLTIVSNGAEVHPIADPNLFDHLQLEYLECHGNLFNSDTNRSIVAKQIILKNLKLIEGELSEDLLNAITDNLTQLEALSISVSHIPVGAMGSLNKLKNLKELSIQGDREGADIQLFNEFVSLENFRIETFNIRYCFDIPEVSIYAIAKSMPNLRLLNFHCHNNFRTFYAILRNFNYVEALHLDPLDVVFFKHRGSAKSLMQSGCGNRRLLDLRMLYPMRYSVKYVEKMVTDYPNLKKLIILPTNKHFDNQLEAILKGFKELESITILKHLDDLRPYHWNVIVEHGKALKFVALLGILESYKEMFLDIAANQTIKNKFDVVKYSEFGGLRMAVDKRTMKVEMESIERFC